MQSFSVITENAIFNYFHTLEFSSVKFIACVFILSACGLVALSGLFEMWINNGNKRPTLFLHRAILSNDDCNRVSILSDVKLFVGLYATYHTLFTTFNPPLLNVPDAGQANGVNNSIK